MAVPLSEFADKMSDITLVIAKEFTRRATCELFKGAITMPQFLVLNFLSTRGDSRMSDLAHFMGVTTAAMTGIVERLVEGGYVTRLAEPNDRRVIKIKLTAKAAGLVKKVHGQRRQMIMDIFGRLSEKDRQDYLKIITEISGILSNGETKIS
ncbi:MAG: MarR family transcriptional regulator [Candidatus Omnitrophica bacterium]|nr:MarR family transcriptional regulator [Candidatus Omnitrophota bacterium]